MKKLHANWEKLNLNLDLYEIYFNGNETECEVEGALAEVAVSDYIVCILPVGHIALYDTLTAKGFSFVETNFSMVNDLAHNTEMIQKYCKAAEHFATREIKDRVQLDCVLQNIRKGMFTTDKYSLDPFVGVVKSNNRYANWLESKFDSGVCRVLEIMQGSKPVGFFSIYDEEEPCTAFSFIGGIYPELAAQGMGFLLPAKLCSWCLENNYRKIRNGVSSNNLPSFRLHLAFGFMVDEIWYLFRRITK